MHTSQEPGPGEATQCCGNLQSERTAIPPAVSLQCPLLSKLNIVPTGKGTIFKGPISIFSEQAMKSGFRSEETVGIGKSPLFNYDSCYGLNVCVPHHPKFIW